MKPRVYNGFLKLKQGDGKFILGWFPSHYKHSRRLTPELIGELKKKDKALLILENESGDSELVEVDGFQKGLDYIDGITPLLRQVIEKEMKKSKFFVAG